jgi:hypothetical protein
MADRLGVTKVAVSVTPVSGVALTELKNRLSLMEREIRHLRTAISDIQNGIDGRDNRLLTSGVMNSRNWTLSLVLSHCYVQSVLEGRSLRTSTGVGFNPLVDYELESLFKRAVNAGLEDGKRARSLDGASNPLADILITR